MTLADELRNLAENWADADNVTTSLRLADEMANKLIWLADNLAGAGLTDERAAFEKDTHRLDWIEQLVKSQGMRGISADYVVHSEDGFVTEKGYRMLWRHMLCERKPSIREAIDAAIEREKGEK